MTEAIVNAVAHRDYTDNSSVQVMLFANRLEVMNSGSLPPPLTVEKLRTAHQSLPANPLIAESMYLLRYIEKMGTGTVDMIRRCAEAGLPEPEFEAAASFTARIWRPASNAGQLDSIHMDTQENQVLPRNTTQENRRFPQESSETTQETGAASLSGSCGADSIPARDRILALLRCGPTLTRTALAARLGITPEGVKYHLDKLRRASRIRHVGPTKKGRWEVLESESTSQP